MRPQAGSAPGERGRGIPGSGTVRRDGMDGIVSVDFPTSAAIFFNHE